MKLLKDILYALCLAGLALGLGEFAMLLHSARAVVLHADAALQEVQATAQVVREYSQEQITRLRDPRQQKAIDAAIQTAAVFNGTGRLINTQLVPRAMKALDSGDLALRNLAATADALRILATETSDSINGHLLPEAAGTMKESTAAIADLRQSLKTAQTALQTTGDDIHRILADPAIGQATAEAARAIKGIADTSDQVAAASKQMPSIAANLEKISKTSSKYSKWLYIASILSALGRAFF